MATETQVVKQLVRRLRAGDWRVDRDLDFYAHQLLVADDPRGQYDFGHALRERQFMAKRLEKRIRKKAAQPFRRKKRGPMRAKAAGKNEVTRRR